MRMRPAYWGLCAAWLPIVAPSLIWGYAYSGGDFTPYFETVGGVIQWLIAVAILLFPAWGYFFFRRREGE